MRSRFACIPLFWLPTLTRRTDLLTAIGIMAFADRNGHAKVGLRTIAKTVGISSSSAQRGIDAMKKAGLIIALAGPKQRSVYFAKLSRLGGTDEKIGVPSEWDRVSHLDGTDSPEIVRERGTRTDRYLSQENFQKPKPPESWSALGKRLGARRVVGL